jgi:hypothetical protein
MELRELAAHTGINCHVTSYVPHPSSRSPLDLFALARQDMFDYIEMFCTPTRKHVRNGMLSPVATGQVHRDAHKIWKRSALPRRGR